MLVHLEPRNFGGDFVRGRNHRSTLAIEIDDGLGLKSLGRSATEFLGGKELAELLDHGTADGA